MKPIITITYCPKCKWMLRATYMAQEVLSTFETEVGGILLKPAEISGQYTVSSGEKILFDRKEKGRFPDIKELKQIIRDEVNPEKDLGHSEKKGGM